MRAVKTLGKAFALESMLLCHLLGVLFSRVFIYQYLSWRPVFIRAKLALEAAICSLILRIEQQRSRRAFEDLQNRRFSNLANQAARPAYASCRFSLEWSCQWKFVRECGTTQFWFIGRHQSVILMIASFMRVERPLLILGSVGCFLLHSFWRTLFQPDLALELSMLVASKGANLS